MSEFPDPYRAPVSPIAEPDPGLQVTAGKGRRFGTFLVDYLGQVILMMMCVIPLALVAGEDTLARIEGMNKLEEILSGLVFLVLYYLLFEGIWGRTPGKWLFGTRVVDESGRAPSFGQVLGRTFSRMVPFEAFSVLMADDADARGWHDRWPRTRVVLAKPRA